ncbi:MAG: hypothetical protein GEU88_20045 [Solirubrobacterales bacterium]|nr:hypothetical protein [Solirubrobacterales bacterium]
MLGLVLALVPALAAARPGHPPKRDGDVARYILPPGNYGGLPTTENSTDQLPLYAGLTPLRDEISDADLERFFLPEDFAPIGATHEEETGRPGLRLIYDSFGIPTSTVRPGRTSPSGPAGPRPATAGF